MHAGAPDWARLGRLVAAERARRGLTVNQFADSAGVSPRTLQRIEAGHEGPYRNATVSRLEDALGWRPGSTETVLAGGEPERTRDPQFERLAAMWPSLTTRQRRALIVFVEEMLG